MDKFHPQSIDLHLKEGHEERDLPVRGIVMFLASLVVLGALAFVAVLAFYYGLEHWRRTHEAPLSAVEQQLANQRERLQQTSVKQPLPAHEETGVKPPPDYYGRGKMEEHLTRTFPVPRLQYDDAFDETLFRTSEERWLSSTGKDEQGNIHIPIDRAMDLLVQRGLPQVPPSDLQPNNLPSAVPLVPAGPSPSLINK
jgi:hypothetical protein